MRENIYSGRAAPPSRHSLEGPTPLSARLRADARFARSIIAACFAVACNGDSGVGDRGGHSDAGPGDAGLVDGSDKDAGESCGRKAKPVDRKRFGVVSEVRLSSMDVVNDVFEYNTEGVLRLTATQFTVGRPREYVFTPDGEIGLVAQDDGTIGVFRIDDTGAVTVLDKGFKGNFYTSHLVMDPGGDIAYVIDTNWRENGGGIYTVRILCDGKLKDEGLLLPTHLANGLALLDSGRAVLFARDVLGSGMDKDIHLLNWGAAPTLIGSGLVFDDMDVLASAFAVTYDGKYALIGDSDVTKEENRVGTIEITATGFGKKSLIEPLPTPGSIAPSPYGNAALIASNQTDHVFRMSYDPAKDPAFVNKGDPTYMGKGPELPGNIITLPAGTLKGRMLTTEVTGIRQFQFNSDGSITDIGRGQLAGGGSFFDVIGLQP